MTSAIILGQCGVCSGMSTHANWCGYRDWEHAAFVEAEGAVIYGHAGRWMTTCGATFQYRADATSHAAHCSGDKTTCPSKGVGHN